MYDCANRLLAPLVPDGRGTEWLAELESEGRHFHGYIPDMTPLPASTFRTEGEANALWETVAMSLTRNSAGPANIWPVIDGIFEELALNAAQHSSSQPGSCAIVECFTSEIEALYAIGVVDLGIGIRSSLHNNSAYRHINDEYDAISRALDMDVTGTEEQRGAGLHFVTQRVQEYRGDLAIMSGNGFLMVRNGNGPFRGDLVVQDWSRHQGTLVLVAIPIPHMGQ